MLEFQDKKKIRKILYSWPVLILGAAILAYLSSVTYRMYQKMSDTGVNRDTAAREQAALLTRQSELNGHIGRLQTDRGIEEEIRKKFRVVKGEEALIIVLDDKVNDKNATITPSGFVQFFDRIKSLFR